MTVQLLYVDDSGDSRHKWISYSWVQVPADDWQLVLSRWLTWRRQLAASNDRIPASVELHATDFMFARSAESPSIDPHWPDQRRIPVMRQALGTIYQLPRIQLGTVFRRYADNNHARHRREVYGHLLNQVQQRFEKSGDLGLIVMDGDGTDRTYRDAHRQLDLDTRKILEDPHHQQSHMSQFVQIADIVAWTTYQHLCRNPYWIARPPRLPVVDWFDKYLAPRHLAGLPLAV